MKLLVSVLAVMFVCTGFLFTGLQITGAYYAEPSGYGFYHIWFGNLYLTSSITILGFIAMLFTLKKMSNMMF